MAMRELERFHELRLRQLVGRAFNHDDIAFGSDVDQIEVALDPLAVSRVGDEFTVYATNSNGADWPLKWNVRYAKSGRRAVNRENIRVIFTIGAKQNGNDLRVVEVTLRKERP